MSEREHVAVAVVALCAVATAAGLEGGYEPRMGAAAFAVGAIATAWVFLRGDVPVLSRPVLWAGGLLAALLFVQCLPVPGAVRHLLAPGQAARLDLVAGEVAVSRAEWLAALTRFDLDVMLGTAGAYDFDLLAGAVDRAWRPLALSPTKWAWRAGQWAAATGLLVVGWRISRSRPALLVFLLGLLALALAEAFFGFANRTGESTGIGRKTAYLGYATGTFVNRGHFAAFLALGVGAAWGLAASIFPLLPDEVRRHAQRKRRSSQPPGVMEASGDKLPRLWLLAFAAGLLSVAMLAASSRGPIVSLALAGLIVGAWCRFRRDDSVHLGLGVAVPAAGLVLAALTAGPFGAVRRFMALGSDDSLSSRVEFWQASWAAWLDAPVLGAGAGSWSLAVAPHELAPHLYGLNHAHAEPVELLVELGVVGAALVAVLAVTVVRAVVARLDVVEHDLKSASAVGLGVALLAVGLQSLGDFPLRTPGILVPCALALGVVVGGLGLGAPGGRRWPLGAVWLLGTLGVLGVGLRDLSAEGSRAERLSEMSPLLLAAPGGRGAVDAACGAAAAVPYDAWAQTACAVAAARVAREQDSAAEAMVADVAATRARLLLPRSPRMQVLLARSMARLALPTLLRDAFAERATALLVEAVSTDGWRAEEAFGIARALGPGAVDRVGAAASTDSMVSRSRALYQYGLVLGELGRKDDARAALEAAAEADPTFGPPHFHAGELARERGDDVAAEAHFRHFLAARDRPVGMEGWVLYALGEREAAEVRFRRAVAVDRSNRWAWEGLAAIARDRHDARAETEALRRVLAITPGHSAATQRLAELGYE